MGPKLHTRKKMNRGVGLNRGGDHTVVMNRGVGLNRGGDPTAVMNRDNLNSIKPEFIEPNIITNTNDFAKSATNAATNAAANTVATVVPNIVTTLDANAAQMKIENDAKLAAFKLKGELDKQARVAAAKTKVEEKEEEAKKANEVSKDETKEEKEEREAAEALAGREEAKAAQIATLKIEIEEIEKELERLKPAITEIYTKTKELKLKNENKTDLTIEELSPTEFKAFKNYVNVYKTLIEKKDELYTAENTSTEEWSVSSIILAPFKKLFGQIVDGIKDGTATAMVSTASVTAEIFAKSMKKMEEPLTEIKEIQARIAAAGIPDVPALPTIPTDVPALPTGLPTVVGGGRNNNLKEIQKGGAAAAKRVETSIKQFLGSSITSSHILNMVKRTTRVKRNRKSKGTRQSRRRAKSQ